MKKILLGLSMAAIMPFASAAGAGVSVEAPWARATLEGMSMGGIFMNITNTGADDVLVGGSSPTSERVEIHTHINDKGVMRMRELENGLPLKKGETVPLKPGSYHVMLMGLKAPLTVGQTFPVTLKFKNTQPQTVTVTVKEAVHSMPMQNKH